MLHDASPGRGRGPDGVKQSRPVTLRVQLVGLAHLLRLLQPVVYEGGVLEAGWKRRCSLFNQGAYTKVQAGTTHPVCSCCLRSSSLSSWSLSEGSGVPRWRSKYLPIGVRDEWTERSFSDSESGNSSLWRCLACFPPADALLFDAGCCCCCCCCPKKSSLWPRLKSLRILALLLRCATVRGLLTRRSRRTGSSCEGCGDLPEA